MIAQAGPEDWVDSLRRRARLYTLAVLAWPVLVVGMLGFGVLEQPLTAAVTVLVMWCLALEIGVLRSSYSGPVAHMDGTDANYQRAVQVCSVAFTVSLLLLSQKQEAMRKLIAVPVLSALLLCTASAVPSMSARQQMGGAVSATLKISVSYAAGLLCVALALSVQYMLAHRARA